MAFSQMAASFPKGENTAFLVVTAGFFGACATLTQPAYARVVFEGGKRAQYIEANCGYEGEISGRVLQDDGRPAVGFVVRADFSRGHTGMTGAGSAKTDSQGNYCIHGLITWAEPFRVKVDNYRTGYVAEPARLIHVYLFPHQKAAHVNFTVRRGPQITVRVSDAETGEPVEGVAVASEEDRIVYSRGQVGETNAKGELVFRADDLSVDLYLDAKTVYAQKRSFAPGYSDFKRIRLTKIADTVIDIKTYKQSAGYPWVTFRGVVLDAKNKAVPGATVRLLRTAEQSETTTDAEGRFSFRTGRVNELRAGVITAEKGGLKTTLYPTAEQTWETLKIQLDPAVKQSEIKGQAVSASGKPLAGVPLIISSRVPDPRNAGPSYLYLPHDYRGETDSSGLFSIKGLPEEASYRIGFGISESARRAARSDIPPLPPVPYPNNWIQVKNGETRDIGRIILYSTDVIIICRIISSPDLPFRRLTIEVEGRHFHTTTTVDEEGNFRIPNRTREPVKLTVYTSLQDNHGSGTQTENTHALYQDIVQAGKTNVTLDLRNVSSEKAVTSSNH